VGARPPPPERRWFAPRAQHSATIATAPDAYDEDGRCNWRLQAAPAVLGL